MTTPSMPMLIPEKSQEGIRQYLLQCGILYQQQWNIRENMRLIDLAYAREADLTKENQRAKVANRYGDKDKLQNMTIPVVLPQVEAAVTYQSSVFLTGVPLFGVVADPQYIDQATQMETVIDQQATRGGWAREFNLFFRDGFKYNISAIEVDWSRETTYELETDLSFQGGQEGKPVETIWEGNRVRRLDMYNTFFDTRVTPAEMYKKGEFVGTREIMSRVMLKQYINKLPEVRKDNIKKAFESGIPAISFTNDASFNSYYIPQINPRTSNDFTLMQGGFNWMNWASLDNQAPKIEYKNLYVLTTLYARIIPSDFQLRTGGQNTPQVWKFVYVNDSVLIYAEKQTNAHQYLPVLMAQPLEDGLAYQTKSLAENVSTTQDVTSALSNANMAARRRAISDRSLYDPSRVSEAHINSPNPSAKIPVRAGAYGKPVSEAVYPFPFRDDQSQYVTAQMQFYGSLANTISGQNQARQGQFVKGNKTQSEYENVMANSNGRDQVTSIGYEAQVFTPLKEILKINILQFQGGISLYNREKQVNVNIDPVALRKAVLNFKVSDGLTPTDKLINSDTMQVALQVFGTSPQIAAAYNIAPFFSYMMKTQGANISAFEKSSAQQAYEQAMGQYQQMVMQLYKQNPDMDPKKLPPQPDPKTYGYDPSAPAGTATGAPTQATGTPPTSGSAPQGSSAGTDTSGSSASANQGVE
jgi:hypothetical protein